MMHAIRDILYFFIWVMIFKLSRRSQPPQAEAEEDNDNLELK